VEYATQEHINIELTQGLITAKIENTPLEQVLSEMQKKTGVKVHIMSSSLAEKEVTLSTKNAEPEDFLKALLGENYVFSYQQASPGSRRILKEVWVTSKSLQPAAKIITKEIKDGSGRENI
jgi:type II secretory pathway component GspD/PulD (secretin)